MARLTSLFQAASFHETGRRLEITIGGEFGLIYWTDDARPEQWLTLEELDR